MLSEVIIDQVINGLKNHKQEIVNQINQIVKEYEDISLYEVNDLKDLLEDCVNLLIKIKIYYESEIKSLWDS